MAARVDRYWITDGVGAAAAARGGARAKYRREATMKLLCHALAALL